MMDLFKLTEVEIVFRLILAVVMGGMIGFEREYKSRPAGMKTHILVCVGATLIALIQQEITAQAIQFSVQNPNLLGVVRTDEARLTAQIVSGIGFLGAGTIIISKQSVTGLTTAASVWSIAGLGIALGMGYYQIALIAFLCIFLSLTLLSYLVPLPRIRRLQVELEHWEETNQFIRDYLAQLKITIDNLDFEVKRLEDENFRTYYVIYTLTLPRGTDDQELIMGLSENHDIKRIKLIY